MTTYADQLAALHNAIIHKDYSAMTPLTKLARHNEISTEERIDIYAKGYHIRLEQATLADYPALAHLVGEDALRKDIHAFTHAYPSLYWDLNLYPSRFADYYKTLSHDNAAIALCELEAAISYAYWQPQSKTLTADALAMLDEEAFGNARFSLHQASKLLALDADAESYLSAFRENESNAQLSAPAMQPTYLLVIRPEKQVMRYLLEKDEYQLLLLLNQQKSFNEALESMPNPEQLAGKLPTYLARWLEWQIFTVNV